MPVPILTWLSDRFLFKFTLVCFIASYTHWPYNNIFLLAVKLQSFYAYFCTFYYSLFDSAWFHVMLYSITYVNFYSFFTLWEFIVGVLLRHYLNCLNRFWHICILAIYRVWPNHIMDLFSLPSCLFDYWDFTTCVCD